MFLLGKTSQLLQIKGEKGKKKCKALRGEISFWHLWHKKKPSSSSATRGLFSFLFFSFPALLCVTSANSFC